jgi:GT2 family glycosyltransferase
VVTDAPAFFRTMDDAAYRRWIEDFDVLSPGSLANLETRLSNCTLLPLIRVVAICDGHCDPDRLARFDEMLKRQTYPHWTCVRASAEGHAILEAATGADFLLPLPLDVELKPTALSEFVLALNVAPPADVIYGDEDVLREGVRTSPQFKPDWDPYLILGRNYVGLPTLFRCEALSRAAMPKPTSRNFDILHYALLLHASTTTCEKRIVHVPSVLCHRTSAPHWDRAEAAAVVRAHLAAQGDEPADVAPAALAPALNHVRFRLPEPAPMVSIIVPTKDRAKLIGPCIEGLLRNTDYPHFEVLIVDNGTSDEDALAILEEAAKDPRVRVLRDPRPFNFSRLNNEAAKAARGEILLLLNNDTEVIHADWLTEMASLAIRPDIGAVGARLLYADARVQHAGVCIDDGPLLYHGMRLAPRAEVGPCGELALLRCVWAVTGACLATRKSLYFDVGGLDEERFRIAYNDIDLCLKIARKGLKIVCASNAELFHFESVSRGLASSPADCARDYAELMAFWSAHHDLYAIADPFLNPQLKHGDGFVDFARPPRSTRFGFGCAQSLPRVPVNY